MPCPFPLLDGRCWVLSPLGVPCSALPGCNLDVDSLTLASSTRVVEHLERHAGIVDASRDAVDEFCGPPSESMYVFVPDGLSARPGNDRWHCLPISFSRSTQGLRSACSCGDPEQLELDLLVPVAAQRRTQDARVGCEDRGGVEIPPWLCPLLARDGYCSESWHSAAQLAACELSCGLCPSLPPLPPPPPPPKPPSPQPPPPPCVDRGGLEIPPALCPALAADGYCSEFWHNTAQLAACERSCGLCGTGSGGGGSGDGGGGLSLGGLLGLAGSSDPPKEAAAQEPAGEQVAPQQPQPEAIGGGGPSWSGALYVTLVAALLCGTFCALGCVEDRWTQLSREEGAKNAGFGLVAPESVGKIASKLPQHWPPGTPTGDRKALM